MKKLLLLLGAVSCYGQVLNLSTPAPQAPTSVSASVNGFGSNSACYWVVARYQIGQSTPAGPTCQPNIPNLPSGGSVVVNWGLTGAVSYDILKTPTQSLPSSCAACLLAGANTSGTVTDTGQALTSYTLTSVGTASGTLSINNRDNPTPEFQFVPYLIDVVGVEFPDGTVQTTAATTPAINTPASNGVLFLNPSLQITSTPTGGAGTLCLVSTAGGTPSFGACSGSAATAFAAITGGTNTATLIMGTGGSLTTGGTGIISANQINGTAFAGTSGHLVGFGAANIPTDSGIVGVNVGLTTSPLSQFASTTSAQLRGVISDESGTGAALFANGAFGTPTSLVLTNATGLPNAGLVNAMIGINGTANQITSSNATPALGGATTLSITNPFIFPGKATTAAGTVSAASLNMPTGNAPTVPVSGDIWNLAGILQFYDGTHTNSEVTIQAPVTSGHCAQFSGTAGLLVDAGAACGTGGGGAAFQVNATPLISATTVNFQNSAAFNGLTFTFSNPSAGNVQLGATGTLTNAGLTNSTIGLSIPGSVFTVVGSPASLGGTITATPAGTSGGVVYFPTTTSMASSGLLTLNNPVLGGGAGGSPTSGTRAGNTTVFATTSGALNTGHCPQFDVNGNLVDSGTTNCGGGAATALSAITAATVTNTIANGNFPQIWNWAQTTNIQNGFTFGETTAATAGTLGNQYLLAVKTLAGSTAVPLLVQNALTGSQTLPALHITPNWNTTGVVDAALLINPVNNASGAGSLLIDAQLGGTSQWKVDKTGISTQAAGGIFGNGSGVAGAVQCAQGTTPVVNANSFGWGCPTTMTTSVLLQSPNAVPTANQFMLFPAPSSNISQFAWTTFSSTNLTDTANLVYNNAVNTFTTAGTLNLSASTVANAMRSPVGAGLTVSATGATGEDTTATLYHNFTGGVDSIVATVPTSVSITTNDCVKWSKVGAVITLADAGATCGSGSGGDTITSPGGTIAVGGTSTNTTLDVVSSVVLSGNPTTTTQVAADNSTRIATTAYVTTGINNAIAGVNPAVAVLAASTANLVGTYSNGVAGVGATFTVTATGVFSLDGVAINTIGQRVLLKDQTSGFQNGVYTATVVGAVAVQPVFTRALDYDTPSDINSTGAIPVQSGTANGSTSWLLTSTVNTVGTDVLTYVKFTLAPTTLVTSAAALVNNAVMLGAGGQASQTTTLQFVSNILNSVTNTQAVTYAGGTDASANSALGGITVRGANQTGTGGASSQGGPVYITGGGNAGTNAASVAGTTEISAGTTTSSAGLQGLIFTTASYKPGATVTQWNLQCPTSVAMTAQDCGASPINVVGVAESSLTNETNVTISGQTPINASAAVTLGHTVCAGTTAGKVTDSGGTAACTTGITVGTVIATTGTWPTFPDGTAFPTLSTTLPLIQLISPASSGGSVSAGAGISVNGSTVTWRPADPTLYRLYDNFMGYNNVVASGFCQTSGGGYNQCGVVGAATLLPRVQAAGTYTQLTVSTLPSAAANPGATRVIKDGASASDCTTGSGTTQVTCFSNGTVWAASAVRGIGMGLQMASSATNPSSYVFGTSGDPFAGDEWMINPLNGLTNWELSFSHFDLEQTTANQQFYFGAINAAAAIATQPASGIWVRFDNVTFTDTHYMLLCGNAGTLSTAIDLGIAPETGDHNISIIPGSVAGTIQYSLDGAAYSANQCATANFPIQTLFMSMGFRNADTTAGKKADMGSWAAQLQY